MGGFLAALGGFGQGVGHYGEQVRSQLEARRTALAEHVSRMAQEETDPGTRDSLHSLYGDLQTNVPMGKNLKTFSDLMSKREKDNQLLHGVVGPGPAAPPPPPPGPTPAGAPAGQGRNMLVPMRPDTPPAPGLIGLGMQQVQQPPFAAQPQSSPAQAGGQLPPMPWDQQQPQQQPEPPSQPQASAPPPAAAAPQMPPSLEPKIESAAEIRQRYMSDPMWRAPANRPMMQAAMTQEIQHNEALWQTHEERKYEMGTKQAALAKIQSSPGWAQMPAWQQSQMQLWASTPGSSIPNMMSSSMMRPVRLGSSPSSAHKPESLLDEDGQQIDPTKVPFVTEFEDRYTGRRFFVPGTGAYTQIAEPGGGVGFVPRVAGAAKASDGSAAQPITAGTSKTVSLGNGQTGFQSVAGAKSGAPPVLTGGVNPSMLGTERSTSSTVDDAGNTHTTAQSHKVAPGRSVVGSGGAGRGSAATALTPPPSGGAGAAPPPAGGTSPAPAASATGGLPRRIPRFDPNNPIDYRARLIAQDASNEKMLTSKQEKIRVYNRMAELGIDPNNVTGSMRERAANARLVLGHLKDVDHILDEADKAGELGVVATRWNDFLTNKLGSDPTKGQVFSKLSANLQFLSTAVAMAHGGVRAGGSPTMVEHWQEALFGKDAATIRQKLAQTRSWMEGYKDLVPDKNDDVMGTNDRAIIRHNGKLVFADTVKDSPSPGRGGPAAGAATPPPPAKSSPTPAPATGGAPPTTLTAGLKEGGRIQEPGPNGAVWVKRNGAMVRE